MACRTLDEICSVCFSAKHLEEPIAAFYAGSLADDEVDNTRSCTRIITRIIAVHVLSTSSLAELSP